MLPGRSRLRSSGDFAAVLSRSGARSGDVRHAGRGSVVVHLATSAVAERGATATGSGVVRVGFVVSGAVGNSVVRHRVTRQLRHIARDRLCLLPAGATMVVRARPSAAGRTSAALAHDVDTALAAVGVRR